MKVLMMLVVASWSAASAATQTAPRAAVALDNARVRAYRTTIGALTGVAHGPGVVIWLRDSPGGKSGRAIWLDDVAVPPATGESGDAIVIVQPLAQPALPSLESDVRVEDWRRTVHGHEFRVPV